MMLTQLHELLDQGILSMCMLELRSLLWYVILDFWSYDKAILYDSSVELPECQGRFFVRSHMPFVGGVTLLGPDLFWTVYPRTQLGIKFMIWLKITR